MIQKYYKEKEKFQNEIEHLKSVQKDLENSKSTVPVNEYNDEMENLERYIAKEEGKIKEQDAIINSYNNVVENMNAIARLNKYEIRDYYSEKEKEEELSRRIAEIEKNYERLPEDLKNDLFSYLEPLNIVGKKQEEIKDRKIVQVHPLKRRDNDLKNQEEINNKKIVKVHPVKKQINDLSNSLEQLNNQEKQEQDVKNESIVPVYPSEKRIVNNSDYVLNGYYENKKPFSTEDAIDVEVSNVEAEKNIDLPTNQVEKVMALPPSSLEKENVQSQPFKENNENELPNNKPFKVVSSKKWNIDKKKILIALGIGALAVATVVAINALIPAIVAAMEANSLATISSSMLTNSNLWHTASLVGQAELHGANATLSSLIAEMTGKSVLFNNVTGVWTIGGTELATYATSVAKTAAAAAAKVSTISNLTTGLSFGGFSALGAGLLTNNKSDEYQKYNNYLREKKKSLDMSNGEAEKIANDIQSNNNLSSGEKRVLLSKISKVVKKINKQNKENEAFEEYEIMEEKGGKSR